MTKYILHGGKSNARSSDNYLFFQEIVKGLKHPIKLLLVYYSREEKEWPRLFQQDINKFLTILDNDDIHCALAAKDRATLVQQLTEADAVYICGGKTKGLKIQFGEINDLAAFFKDKVIAGSSAGAHVLCKYYYNKQEDKINEGLGVIPIKLLCHYDNTKSGVLSRLEQHNEKLEIIVLEEGKFVTLNY